MERKGDPIRVSLLITMSDGHMFRHFVMVHNPSTDKDDNLKRACDGVLAKKSVWVPTENVVLNSQQIAYLGPL